MRLPKRLSPTKRSLDVVTVDDDEYRVMLEGAGWLVPRRLRGG